MGKISQQIKIFIWAIFFCILEGGLVVAQLAKAVHSSQKTPPGKWIQWLGMMSWYYGRFVCLLGTFPDNCVFEMRNKIQGFLSTEFE